MENLNTDNALSHPTYLRKPSFSRRRVIRAFFSVALCLAFSSVVDGQAPQLQPMAHLISVKDARPRVVSSSLSGTNLPASVNSIEQTAFAETNQARIKNGLPPFTWDEDLWRMAREHSEHMARGGFFSHVTPEGLRLRDRAKRAGIVRFTEIGENIAYNDGFDDPGLTAVQQWMLSAGHRANILNAGFQSMAVGSFVAADGTVYLTQAFIMR